MTGLGKTWMLALCLAGGLFTLPGWAQESDKSLVLPADPGYWINSHPWNLEQLRGKAVFLLFFEEDCPRCRGRWPELNRLMQSHSEDPILFIAVSSGTDREAMEVYARQCSVAWPVLLDPERSLEQACDVGEISLENILQVSLIGGDGKLSQGSWRDLEESVTSALKDARWTVDPKFIPEPLKPTWQQIEFRNYTAAGPALKKALKSSKEELKSAAEDLLAVVQPVIDEKVAAADQAYEAQEKWTAYRAYTELAEQFKGYELPDVVESRKKELQSDPKIRGEAAAMKLYLAAAKQVDSTAQRKKGIAALKKLAKDKPDTEAGRKAQSRLDALD